MISKPKPYIDYTEYCMIGLLDILKNKNIFFVHQKLSYPSWTVVWVKKLEKGNKLKGVKRNIFYFTEITKYEIKIPSTISYWKEWTQEWMLHQRVFPTKHFGIWYFKLL